MIIGSILQIQPCTQYTKCRDTYKPCRYFSINPVKKVQLWLYIASTALIRIPFSCMDCKPDKIHEKEQKTDHSDYCSRDK